MINRTCRTCFLTENWVSNNYTRWFTTAFNFSSRGSNTLLWPLCHLHCICTVHTSKHTQIHRKEAAFTGRLRNYYTESKTKLNSQTFPNLNPSSKTWTIFKFLFPSLHDSVSLKNVFFNWWDGTHYSFIFWWIMVRILHSKHLERDSVAMYWIKCPTLNHVWFIHRWVKTIFT